MANAQVVITGTPENPVLNFTVPQGEQGLPGPAGSLTVGTVSTSTTNPASITILGTAPNQTLNMVIPKGDPGGWVASSFGNVHLDTIILPGTYQQPNGAFSTTANGYPAEFVSRGVSVRVYPANSGAVTSIEQEISSSQGAPANNSRSFARRSLNNLTWSPWRFFNSVRTAQTTGVAIYQWDEINNREQLIYGDTGWRDITSSLANGFRGSLSIRRKDPYTVYLRGDVQPPVAGTTFNGIFIPTLPTGFTSGAGPWVFHPVKTNANSTWMTMYRKGSELTFEGSPTVSDTNVARFEVSWATTDVWPTTLPGTASGTIPNL